MNVHDEELEKLISNCPEQVKLFIQELVRENAKLNKKLAESQVKILSHENMRKATLATRPLSEFTIEELDEFIQEGMKLIKEMKGENP